MTTRRRKNRAHGPDSSTQYDKEFEIEIKNVEDRFKDILNPIEDKITTLQRILVWENPPISAAVFLVVNILFWLATRMRFYRLLGLTGCTVVFMDMWIKKIWPEIRLPPPADEDDEGWLQVHPKLLSVPELCQHLAKIWVFISHWSSWLWQLRQKSHLKFFMLTVTVLSALAFLGTQISDFYLCYSFVMICWTLPAAFYHSLPQRFYAHIEPHILNFEQTFNVKRRKTKRAKRRHRNETSVMSLDSDSDSDEAVKDFCPSPTTTSETTLHRASGGSVAASPDTLTPSLLSPDIALSGSIGDASDLDDATDEDSGFSKGLKSMPGIDDSRLDDSFSNDEIALESQLELPDESSLSVSENEQDTTLMEDTPSQEQTTGSMEFVATHFNEPSESSSHSQDEELDENMASGLNFPDIREVEMRESAEAEETRQTFLGQMSAAVTSEVVRNTMGSLMASTVTGLSHLTQSVRQAASGTTSHPENQPQQGSMTSSGDRDILEEFEFLEQEEMLDVDDGAGDGQ